MTHSHLSLQEAVRKAQEELAKQKEVIMAQDKELKVDTILPVDTLVFDPYLRVLTSGLALTSLTVQTISWSFICNWTIQGKSTEANKIREQNNEVQLKIKELEHNISKHRKDSQDAADKVHTHLCISQFCTIMIYFHYLWKLHLI